MRTSFRRSCAGASEGRRVAIATVVERRGSAPRDPGASLALNDRGEIAGSVTGGCVEPSVIREAQEVLDGGEARVREYGIADDEAFEVGLSCGGTVGILIAKLDTSLLPELDEAVRADRPAALTMTATGRALGEQQAARRRRRPGRPAPRRAARAPSPTSTARRCSSTRSRRRPAMYVFGAIDHAAALARVGKLLGYRVTVCDARAAFVTPERFPRRTSSSSSGPTASSQRAPVDETHRDLRAHP